MQRFCKVRSQNLIAYGKIQRNYCMKTDAEDSSLQMLLRLEMLLA